MKYTTRHEVGEPSETGSDMKITGLVSWYGSNRMNAKRVGEMMGDVPFAAIAFAGSMCEIRHLRATSIVVADAHRHLITTARVVADPAQKDELVRRLDSLLVHEDEIARAHRVLHPTSENPEAADIDIAEAYFILSWMGRSNVVGSRGEHNLSLAVRYDAGGGDGAKRYRSAVESLEAWHRSLRRCVFYVRDFAETIAKVPDEPLESHRRKDVPPRGIYCDPPFPGPGDKYIHTFGEDRHRELARLVSGRSQTRVIMRYYDHPLVRELYPESDGWRWDCFQGRDQHRQVKPEVLIWNGV